MALGAHIPECGRLAYLGPPLRSHARHRLEDLGYTPIELEADAPEPELPEGSRLFVFGLGEDHPSAGAFRAVAKGRGLPVFSDLEFLGALADKLTPPPVRRVLITGSAGKSMTAELAETILKKGDRGAKEVGRRTGYLNALGLDADTLLLTVLPSHVGYADRLDCGAGLVLNLTEEEGEPIRQETRSACVRLLTGAQLAVLGTDDSGAQSLLMSVRRKSAAAARSVLPVSGEAALPDGWFALGRVLYAVRNGRTRRVADFRDSPGLIGDHQGQNAAAAAALASFLGLRDEQIAAGLENFSGLAGRFECIGSQGRIVFVDDRHASTMTATKAALASCPEVLWIGHRLAPDLPNKTKDALRGAFYLQAPDRSGPKVDNVVTFATADEATEAALQAAGELLRRKPEAMPVLLFSPGAPGFERQGDLFKLKVLSFLAERSRSHG